MELEVDGGGETLPPRPPPPPPAPTPPPPPAAVPQPPPPPATPPPSSAPYGDLPDPAGYGGSYVNAAQVQDLIDLGYPAAAVLAWQQAVNESLRARGVTPPGGVPPPTATASPAPPTAGSGGAGDDGESYDIGDDPEAGPEPTLDDYLYWEDEAEGIESGRQLQSAATHPAAGTIIGYPYQGTHAIAFNKAGGSDNWQSENAVDIWLYPGTPILAVQSGTISPGGYGYGLSAGGGRFAGWRLHLIDTSGRAFFYTHMQRLVAGKGQAVAKGDVIGYSGIANGVPHLHLAARPPTSPEPFARAAWLAGGRIPPAGQIPAAVTGTLDPWITSHAGIEQAWLDLQRVVVLDWQGYAGSIADARRRLAAAVA